MCRTPSCTELDGVPHWQSFLRTGELLLVAAVAVYPLARLSDPGMDTCNVGMHATDLRQTAERLFWSH